MTARAARRRFGRLGVVFWSWAGFFAVGYFPTMMLKNPVLSMSVAACLVIPFGMRSTRVRQGLLWGLGLGLAAGGGTWAALMYHPLPEPYQTRALVFLAAPVVMCAAVAALFAYVARRRRQRIEDQWG